MAAGRRAGRAASIAVSPQTVEDNVLERLASEVGLLAHELLELVRLVLVIQGVVLQDRQGLFIQIVCDHDD